MNLKKTNVPSRKCLARKGREWGYLFHASRFPYRCLNTKVYLVHFEMCVCLRPEVIAEVQVHQPPQLPTPSDAHVCVHVGRTPLGRVTTLMYSTHLIGMLFDVIRGWYCFIRVTQPWVTCSCRSCPTKSSMFERLFLCFLQKTVLGEPEKTEYLRAIADLRDEKKYVSVV